MQYQNMPHILPQEIYTAYLGTINSIQLSKREIDIIACIMNGRSSKGTGHFLSISPRTVEVHTRNAMKKLGCTSRESLITLIEHADQFLTLKDYYLKLLAYNAFEKSLKEIAKLVISKGVIENFLIIYWQEKNRYFFNNIKTHLTLVGVSVILEEREKSQSLAKLIREAPHETYTVYAIFYPPERNKLTPHRGNTGIIHPPQNFSQALGKILFLLSSGEEYQEIPQEIMEYPYINISEQKNYYFLIFAILKQILPNLNLEKIADEFEKRYWMLQGSGDLVPTEADLEENTTKKEEEKLGFQGKKFQNLIHKRGLIAFFLGIMSLFGGSFFLFKGKRDTKIHSDQYNTFSHSSDYRDKTTKGTITIRSDLLVPAEPLLLQRLKIIRNIDHQFKKQKDGIQTIALIGIGGAGKTTLARQYAHSQKSSVIWEINAETYESLNYSFEALAQALTKTEEDKKELRQVQSIKNSIEKEKKIMDFVKNHLRSRPNWLLIFDNIEKMTDIQKHFPHNAENWGSGKIILTTQDKNTQHNSYIQSFLFMGELSGEEKYDLFFKTISHGDARSLNTFEKQKIQHFVKELPPFPLDISSAAHYIKATNISYEDYLERLKNYDKNFEITQGHIVHEASGYTKTRFKIISLSIAKLVKINKEFQDLLLLISLIDSQDIPRELLENYKDKAVVDDFMYHLKKYSLITNESHTQFLQTFSIHRSTQQIGLKYFMDILGLENNKKYLNMMICVLEKYLNILLLKVGNSKINILARHSEALLKHTHLLTDNMKGALGKILGCILYHKSYYLEAKQILEESISRLNKSLPENHTRIAIALMYLGNSHRGLGDYEKAKNLLKESLVINKKYFSENSAEIARILVCLGYVFRKLGNYKSAKSLFEEALSIYRKHLSEDTPVLAWALTHLGVTYEKMGCYVEAKKLFKKSLIIFREYKIYPGTAWVFGHLGIVHTKTDNHEKAKILFEQSITIYKEHFSEEHIHVAWSLAHLGVLYGKLGNYIKARIFLERSLESYEKNYGKTHIATAQILKELGQVYLLEAHLEAAEGLIRKALIIFQQHKHPEAYGAFENIAEIYFKKSLQAKGEGNEQRSQEFKNRAIDYLKQALKIVETYFSPDSSHLKRIHCQLKELEDGRTSKTG